MNRNQNSHGLARNLIPEQVIQKRKRRRNKNRKKPQIHVMDRIDLRNLLDGDQKRKNTSNKRSHEEDNAPTKRLKNHHVSSKLESSSSSRLPTSPRTSSNFKSPPISPRASSNFKSPPTSPHASLSKNFDSGSNVRKSNKISLESWSNKNTSPLTASRRNSLSPRPKKNIAAQRLESLRKSLPENIHSATSTISKKEKHLSNSSRLSEINSSNEHLWNSQSLSGRSNRSSANDRLNALRNKLTVQASETQNNIEPSTSTDNMEYQEEMEWEQVPEEHIIKNIVEIRNSVQENPNIFNGLESSFCFHDSLDMVFNASNVREKSKFIIVIDTNIFLSDLQIVKNLLNCNCNDNDLTIVVPWMVFQELDFFKTKGAKLKQNAQIAVRFINGELANKNPKLKGQTALEAAENVITCRGPDDRILDCSLQYKSDNNITIILSNDINLRNKALVNNIEAYCSDEILKIIASKMENVNKISVPTMDKDLEEKFRQFHKILSNFLLKMLEREMYIAYGDLWKRMVQFKTTWTVPTIIKCILKYWKSVFSFVYPKHLRPCLSQLLQSFDDCELSDPDLKNLIDTALAVCLHLQNISEEYFQIILPIIKELKNLL